VQAWKPSPAWLIVLALSAFWAHCLECRRDRIAGESRELMDAGNYLEALAAVRSPGGQRSLQCLLRGAPRALSVRQVLDVARRRGTHGGLSSAPGPKRSARSRLGNISNLLQGLLERFEQPMGKAADETMQAAEAAFSRGDLDAALAAYQDIALRDPASYEARLYAGDVYFRKKNLISAGEWFQKAIAVDPNRETAYRYWGDAFLESSQAAAAMHKFIDAVIAEPYSRSSWMGLAAVGRAHGHGLAHPRIDGAGRADFRVQRSCDEGRHDQRRFGIAEGSGQRGCVADLCGLSRHVADRGVRQDVSRREGVSTHARPRKSEHSRRCC
jgi:tetratricopeptide (TPR) repeat protein